MSFKMKLSQQVAAISCAVFSVGTVWAVSASDYALTPLSLTKENTPLVMLAMSNDEQLYYKAYNDYTDVDSDGVLDVFYKGAELSSSRLTAFDYAGYFDPGLCYKYDSGEEVFKVTKQSIERYNVVDDKTTALIPHSCDDDGWSGNFLNWVSMTRIDVMRSSLYGGKRVASEDDTTVPSGESWGSAVLEVSVVPNDVHSFAKVYPKFDASDSDSVGVPDLFHTVPDAYVNSAGITLCTTSAGGKPILRVVKGLYPFWSSKEGTQCNFSGSSAPASTERIGTDMVLRVEACKTAYELTASRCRQYHDGTNDFFKPAGLLQRFGEDGRIEFGLISGSYHRNVDGGVIRSEIGKLAGNSDSSDDEVNLSNGAFNSSVNRIIQSIEKFRIVNHDGGRYTDCNTYKIPPSYLKNPTDNSKRCSNWGNPISEIYYEALRYFAGNTEATSRYSVTNNSMDDADFIAGLNSEFKWTNPLNANNFCTKCSILLLSSGAPSFDIDVLDDMDGDVPDLDSSSALTARTNQVGDIEYDTLKDDEKIASDGDFCNEIKMPTLSEVSGTCPDKPQSEGSYHLAGLAYHGRISDLQTYSNQQRVNTYAIELADSVPIFDFNIDGNEVAIIPACQSYTTDKTDYTYCSLNDVKFRTLEYDSAGNLVYANIYVMWEDSQWGNDFDMDVVQRIDICTSLNKDFTNRCENADGKVSDGKFSIEQQIVLSSGGLRFRASYSLAGTTSDGLHQIWTDKSSGNDGSSTDFSWDENGGAPDRVDAVHVIDSTTEVAEPLKTPMYLAAKFGGFIDKNGNNKPDKVEEWDSLVNETGLAGSDGVPDNYFKVRNPNTLEAQLGRVFNTIVERVSSGSNAAVVANRASGNGAIYQAVYYPTLTRGENTVSWVGQLHSLFVDSAGLIREDYDQDKLIDDAPYYDSAGSLVPGDFIVRIFYDEDDQDTYFQRFVLAGNSGDKAKIAVPYGLEQDLELLRSTWNAAKELAKITDTQLLTQRSYSGVASSGRHILSSYYYEDCPTTTSTIGDPCEKMESFTPANNTLWSGYLGYDLTELLEAEELIEWVRGIDKTDRRSRAIDMNADGAADTWRLGDIIHSTPHVVERPTESYDRYFGDDTYAKYVEKYDDRRRMIYVGSNGGMIHAFNGGFWDPVCNGFMNSATATGCLQDESEHPLGSELWAYVPRNLLPHLKWQAQADYPHMFYVDGAPQSYDVRIFDDDDVHPGGWGTILVVPMRQGGGDISVDHDNDGSGSDIQTLRSAIVVLDITDPEQPPELIAEITDENLGMSLSKPTLIKQYLPSAPVYDNQTGDVVSTGYGSPLENHWYLAFGSGPWPHGVGQAGNSTSSQNGHLYAYDLKEQKLIKSAQALAANSYFVGFEGKDWDEDGATDAVYFGSVSGSGVSDQSGKLFRWNLTSSVSGYIDIDDSADLNASVMLDVGNPIVSKPTLSRAPSADRWVHFGTGRYLVNDDRTSTVDQDVFGINEPRDENGFTWGQLYKANLVDSTDLLISTVGGVIDKNTGENPTINGTKVQFFKGLEPVISSAGGWYRDLTPGTGASNPSGRVLREGLIYQDQYIFTEYVPSGEQCDVNGRSNLFVTSWATGTALPYDALASTTKLDTDGDGTVEEYVDVSSDLGVGEFSGVTVFETSTTVTMITDTLIAQGIIDGTISASDHVSDVDGGNCVFVQSSTGEMVCRRVAEGQIDASGRQSWREVEILF